MFNQKKMKTMKKLIFSAFALIGLLTLSCTREVEAPVNQSAESAPTHRVSIRATIGEETRTSYANDKTFSWVQNDTILVYVTNSETNKAYLAPFLAQSSGASAEFVGEVEDGFAPSNLAFYTAAGSYATWDEKNFYVNLPGTTAVDDDSYYYHVDSSNPMSNVPLMGVEENGVFHFFTLTGVLKFNLTDLDPSACGFELTSADGNMLQGQFAVDLENGTINREGGRTGTYTYTDDEGTEYTLRYSYANLYYRFTPDAEGKATIYVPVPVGKLGAGATFNVFDEAGNLLYEQKTTKDIPITRNKLTELAPLKASFEWKSLGMGKFTDAYTFADYGVTEGLKFIDVEIQQCQNVSGYYRLVHPYEEAIKQIKGAVPEDFSGSPYFLFRTLQVGESLYGTPVTIPDQIYYEPFMTGMIEPETNTSYEISHPSNWTKFDTERSWGRNNIAKYQKDGKTPAIVLVGPVYIWDNDSLWSGNGTTHLSSKNFQIFFPNVKVISLDLDSSVSFNEIADDSVEQPVASVTLSLGPDANYADVVVAADEASALAALTSGQGVTEALTSSKNLEVMLPANAPTGQYKVYAMIYAADEFTASTSQLVSSREFWYFNADEDAGFTVSDMVGDYISEPIWCYYYQDDIGDYDWTISNMDLLYIHVEESDDDFSGNVMITSMGTFWGAYVLAPNTDNVFNIYGEFNTKTGLSSFDTGVPFYDLESDNTAISPAPSFDCEPFEFFLYPDKETLLYNNGQVFWLAYNMRNGQIDGFFQVSGGYPDTPITLYKVDMSEEAPSGIMAARATQRPRNYWLPMHPVKETVRFDGK